MFLTSDVKFILLKFVLLNEIETRPILVKNHVNIKNDKIRMLSSSFNACEI